MNWFFNLQSKQTNPICEIILLFWQQLFATYTNKVSGQVVNSSLCFFSFCKMIIKLYMFRYQFQFCYKKVLWIFCKRTPDGFTVIYHTHLCRQKWVYRVLFALSVTITWHSSIIRICAKVQIHLTPPEQCSDPLVQYPGEKEKKWCCLKLCLQRPAGQEMQLSGDCPVKNRDF